MLKTHMDAVEEALLATSKIPANSGHSLHKGTPREVFVRDFLVRHLAETLTVGTGEIIDANSAPGEARNQIDIVIHKRTYPRLDLGGGINAFLAESVLATISVKSTLKKDEFVEDMRAAKAIKSLSRSIKTGMTAGYVAPSILSYVVAYDGPASMETVHGWVQSVAQEFPYPVLPSDGKARNKTVASALDAVFVLGRGFMHYGNSPLGFISDELLVRNPKAKWAICDADRGSLLLLFLFLTMAASGTAASWLNPLPYLARLKLPAKVGP